MKKSLSIILAIIMLFSVVNVSVFAASIATPKVKATNTLSGVSVTWNKVSGAAKYVVYKRLGTSSTWAIIATTKNTSFEDKGTLYAGKYYVYSVKAYNSAGKPSDYIKANCATVQRVIAPYTKASNALDGINVTWGKVAGATKYVVLRRIGTESTWKTLCTTTGTSFLDKNVKAGIYYLYSIRAVNSTGYSAYDVNKRITVQRVVAPYTKAVNAVNGINVSWGKVAGATKYVVLRRIGTESTWKTLCTTTSTSFLDGSVKPGIYYLYSIRAVNGTGYSAYDVNKRITVQRILTPTAKAEKQFNAIRLSWNSVTSASKYSVYRRLGGTSTWELICTTTDTIILDKNVEVNKYYAYSIRAINGTGYSAYDSSKCAVVQHGTPIKEHLPRTLVYNPSSDTTIKITINADGSVKGTYRNPERGVTGPDYPKGLIICNDFTGKFTNIKQIDDSVYTMTLSSYTLTHQVGDDWYSDGYAYYADEIYGLKNNVKFILYTPGTPIPDMPEEVLMSFPGDDFEGAKFFNYYCLYNVDYGCAFFEYNY